MKLSRVLSNHNGVSRQQANQWIAEGRVLVDGRVCRNAATEVSRFQSVQVGDKLVQAAEIARYLMLNKPAGILSATRDPQHRTALDLLPENLHPGLHIAGRLDRASTGLLILTNDGAWSRHLTEPKIKVPKVYRVSTLHPIEDHAVARFAEGIHFRYEQLTTSPAKLEPLAPCEARVTIYEGRYHQVKRMFHAVGNRVTRLHRESMGAIRLDDTLKPGAYRMLAEAEILSVCQLS